MISWIIKSPLWKKLSKSARKQLCQMPILHSLGKIQWVKFLPSCEIPTEILNIILNFRCFCLGMRLKGKELFYLLVSERWANGLY